MQLIFLKYFVTSTCSVTRFLVDAEVENSVFYTNFYVIFKIANCDIKNVRYNLTICYSRYERNRIEEAVRD